MKIKCQLSIFMLFFSVLECLRYFFANSLLLRFTPLLCVNFQGPKLRSRKFFDKYDLCSDQKSAQSVAPRSILKQFFSFVTIMMLMMAKEVKLARSGCWRSPHPRPSPLQPATLYVQPTQTEKSDSAKIQFMVFMMFQNVY